MPWYRTGTVSVTLNSNAVIGTGTAFVANSRVGDAFLGPDGGWYEVTNIASDSAMSIAPNYRGATNAAGVYALTPVQGYTKDLADQARSMIQQWGATLAGLGTVSTENIVPVAKGGTGANTQAAARTNLGLGNAATATIGTETGNVLTKGAFGLGGAARYVTTNPDSSSLGSGFNYYDDQSGGSSQANGRFGIRFSFGAYLNQGFELLAQPWNNKLYFRYSSVSVGAPWYEPLEIYHTGNTTRAADGTLKAI